VRNNARRSISVALVVLGAVAILTPARAAERKLVIQAGSPAPNQLYAPVFVAQEMGYLKAEGLDVAIQYSAGSFLAAQLAAAGKADVGNVSFEPVATGYAKGMRGKFFYQYLTKFMFYLGVPAEGAIQTVSDLRGRKIGVQSLGSAALVAAKSQLKAAGISPDQVSFLPVGIGQQAATALKGGQVDALALWDTPFAALENSGMKFRYFHHPVLQSVGNVGFFASEASLETNKDALQGLSRAVAKGTVFALENPEAAVRIYWKMHPGSRGTGDEAEALRKGMFELNFIMRSMTLDDEAVKKYGYQAPEDWHRLLDFLKAEAVIPEKPPVEQLMTNKFIDYANDFDVAAVKRAAKEWKAK
jgi:NitT/TauT family transport system substrate-binding protein